MVARVERRKFDYKEHDVIFGGGENVLYLDCGMVTRLCICQNSQNSYDYTPKRMTLPVYRLHLNNLTKINTHTIVYFTSTTMVRIFI